MVSSPSTGSGQSSPAFMRMKLPVPMVALVMPRSKQACPKRAACWSPAIALIGTPASGEEPPSAEPSTTAEPAAGRAHLRQDRHRDAEEVAELVRPPPVHDVEEHGARGVGGVGGEDPAGGPPGQVPQHPGVDGAQGQVGPGRNPARSEQPLHLGGREVRVEDQAGPLADQREMPGLGQGPAGGGRPAVLPDHGPVEGVPGGPVPGHHRLALVGDADGLHGPPGVGEPAGHLGEGGSDRRQISPGSCSTQPGRGKYWVSSR